MSQGDPVDELIRTVLLEERSGQTSLVTDQYCVRWTLANDVQLVFVAVFQVCVWCGWCGWRGCVVVCDVGW